MTTGFSVQQVDESLFIFVSPANFMWPSYVFEGGPGCDPATITEEDVNLVINVVDIVHGGSIVTKSFGQVLKDTRRFFARFGVEVDSGSD